VTRRQCFVEFLSPGMMFDETTSKPIESPDIKLACKMAAKVEERHGARPYGFQFATCLVADPIDDGEGGKMEVSPKEIERSGTHYIDGVLKTVDELAKTEGERSILVSNMRGNDWPIVCETKNGYRHTGVFSEKDLVVSIDGKILERGDDPKHVAYRRKVKARK